MLDKVSLKYINFSIKIPSMAIFGLKTFDSFLNTMLRNYFEFMTEILRTFIAQKVLKIGAVARLEFLVW